MIDARQEPAPSELGFQQATVVEKLAGVALALHEIFTVLDRRPPGSGRSDWETRVVLCAREFYAEMNLLLDEVSD